MSRGTYDGCDTSDVSPRRPWALLLAFGLLAAACSSGEEPATDDPALSELLAPSGDGAADDSTTTLLPPTPTDPPEIEGPMFAGRPVECGGRLTTVGAGVIGVDGSTITIGTGNDRGGFFAGDAGRSMPDAVAAMAGLCNELGGLAGRTVVVRDYDAAVVEVAGRATQQCDEVAALVGYGFLDDVSGVEAWSACGLPLLPGWDRAVIEPPLLLAHGIAALGDPAALVVAVIGPQTSSGALTRTATVEALTADGFTVAVDAAYAVTGPMDWDELAADLRRAEVGLVHVDGGCTGVLVPLLAALDGESIAPFVIGGHRAYDPVCIAEGATSSTFDRLMLELPFLPLEDGEAAPATAAYADALERFLVPVTGDSLLAAAAFWRFADATSGCPALERSCLQVATLAEWDGLGLFPAGENSACRVVLGVSEGEFVRITPEEPGEFARPTG